MKPANLEGKRVLVVEDTEDSQLLIRKILEHRGAHVAVTSNGLEALEDLSHNTYDLVLMDIRMPVMDGYEAVIQLRQRGYTGKIIALTAHALKNEMEKALQLGFDDYLTKPIQMELLDKKLIELLL